MTNERKIKCLAGTHEDKHPSASLNIETGLWHCFSCNASGKVSNTNNSTASIIKKEAKQNLMNISLVETINTSEDYKLHCRRIKNDCEKHQRFLSFSAKELTFLEVTKKMIDKINTTLNKKFNENIIKYSAVVRDSRDEYYLTTENQIPSCYHLLNSNDNCYVSEGLTDFFTVISHKTNDFSVISRKSKQSSINLTEFKNLYFFIDKDDNITEALKYLNVSKEANVYVANLKDCKDISDFVNVEQFSSLSFSSYNNQRVEPYEFENGKIDFTVSSVNNFFNENGYVRTNRDKNNVNSELVDYYVKDFKVEAIDKTAKWSFLLNHLNVTKQIEAQNLAKKVITTIAPTVNLITTNITFDFYRDIEDDSYFFFKNTAVKVFDDRVVLEKYSKYVYNKDVIDFNFTIDPDFENTSFVQFCKKTVKNYDALRSAIGYLLHSYKNPANAKAIIFVDENVDGSSNGGRGKSLISEAIKKMRATTFMDASIYKKETTFQNSKFKEGDKIVVYEDANEHFNFKNLYNTVTGDFFIERKGQNAYSIPFSDSPKILITCNNIPKLEGNSSSRRVYAVEFSDFFTKNDPPDVFFGEVFFQDWIEKTDYYNKFYNFMISCLQFYLREGLVENHTETLEIQQLNKSVGFDYVEILDDTLQKNTWIDKIDNAKILNDKFVTANLHVLTSHSLTKKLNEYCRCKNLKIEEKVVYRQNTTRKMFCIIDKNSTELPKLEN